MTETLGRPAMRARAYTVAEIDRMRELVERLDKGQRYWHFNGDGGFSSSGGSYSAVERSARIEDRLRTYMTNGTTPEELAEVAQALDAAERQQQEASRLAWAAHNEKSPAPS